MFTVLCQGRKFHNIQGIIFDKDGTLADSQEFLWQLAHKRANVIEKRFPKIRESLLLAFGIQEGKLNPTGLMAVGSRLENETAAAGYIAARGKSWFEAMEIARQAFLEADQQMPKRAELSPLFPSTIEVLAKLSQSGLKLGILSADSTEGVQSFINQHQLSDYIQLAMGVDSQLTKPNPELFRRACAALDIPPTATLMVGDSPGDIDMAKKAESAGTIGIAWSNQTREYLLQADIVIDKLTEIVIKKYDAIRPQSTSGLGMRLAP